MLSHDFSRHHDISRLYDEAYYQAYLFAKGEAAKRDVSSKWHFLRNAHLFDTGLSLSKRIWKGIKNRDLFAPVPTYEPDAKRLENSSSRIILKDGKTAPTPDFFVEPLAFHSLEDIEKTVWITKQSLDYVRKYFSKSRIWLVYIPTISTTYDFVDNKVNVRDRLRFADHDEYGPSLAADARELYAKSNLICDKLAKIAKDIGVPIIDVRSHLRKSARQSDVPLHGPVDWHLNKAGYHAFGMAIIDGMKNEHNNKCKSIGQL